VIPGIEPAFILVADSSSVTRQLAALLLRSRGWHVLEARSGQEGLQLFRTVSPAVRELVVDSRLIDMSGSELARRLVEQQPRLAVLMLHDGSPLPTPFPSLAKPFAPDELLRQVEELLRRARGSGHTAG
jgi:DNA-binding response OmpR family regulator